MKNLLVFATERERNGVLPLGAPLGWEALVTGVGPVATAVVLARVLAQQDYGVVLHLGIAGAYVESGLVPGDLVRVDRDCLLEFGTEEADASFCPWDRPELGGVRCYTATPVARPFNDLYRALAALPGVQGATVLTCTGTEATGRLRGSWAQIESMEGAAFFAAAQSAGVAAFAVRAVSNVASTRDFAAWHISESLDVLQRWVALNLQENV